MRQDGFNLGEENLNNCLFYQDFVVVLFGLYLVQGIPIGSGIEDHNYFCKKRSYYPIKQAWPQPSPIYCVNGA